MKFGRILMMLMTLIEQTLPDWKDQFLSYKDLKKQLKLIYPNKRQKMDVDDRTDDGIDKKEVNDFVKLLEKEIDKFNTFFLEKEEDYIIQLEVLRDCVAEIRSSEELVRVERDLVDLHGQIVLLKNYSSLNYTGLVKILKKYDKRTGALIRVPVIQKVLEEPFFKVDVLNKLVKECEAMLSILFTQSKPSKVPVGEGSSTEVDDTEEPAVTEEKASKAPGGEGSGVVKDTEELSEIDNVGNMYLNLTKSALRILRDIRSGSSTVSMFSLPPLEKNEMAHEAWKNIPVVEQVAK